MNIPVSVLKELQNRLKVGNRRGVHLNAAIPKKRTAYKLDLKRLDVLREGIAHDFVDRLLTEEKLNFKISWNAELPSPPRQTEFQEQQADSLNKIFVALNRNAKAIESESGINTFGFGYPILAFKSKKDGKQIIAPLFIWSLSLKKLKSYRTWQISRTNDSPFSINEILANYLEADSEVYINQEQRELTDGFISRDNLENLINNVSGQLFPTDLTTSYRDSLLADSITKVLDKNGYEELLERNPVGEIVNAGIFSLFSVQKQNLIKDYTALIEASNDVELTEGDFSGKSYEDLTHVGTDPSQQGRKPNCRIAESLIFRSKRDDRARVPIAS